MAAIQKALQPKWKADIHREWIDLIFPYLNRPNGLFGGFIVGGAARGICMEKTDYGDIDIACVDPEMRSIVNRFFLHNFRHIYDTEYSTTYELPMQGFPANRVQLLKLRVGQPEDVIRTFPLTVEQFAVVLTPGEQEYICYHGEYSVHDAWSEVVNINEDTEVHPDGILYRAFKYAGKGFRVEDRFYPQFFKRVAGYSFDREAIEKTLEKEGTEKRYGN